MKIKADVAGEKICLIFFSLYEYNQKEFWESHHGKN